MERKNIQEKGVFGKAAILNVMIRVGMIEKVAFEQTLEGEGMSHVTL